MKDIRLRVVKDKFLHSDNFLFTLLRSGASAQLCGWIDMISSYLLFAFCNTTPWLSTALGALIGGIFNCVINYKFTFHSQGVSWHAVAAKFGLVWIGSLLLNSFGTQWCYYVTREWHWLVDVVGLDDDTVFLAARLTVSLVVSLAWNFVLQRCFVFRPTPFDKYIVKTLNFMGIGNIIVKNGGKSE